MTDNNTILNAIKASIHAGKEVLEVYETGDFGVDMKSDDSPLTIADIKSHQKIMEFLEGDIPVLSEEGKEITFEERKDWNLLWIIDPLDGTKEFIKRNGEFTINIALVENGNPIFGVIYVPVMDKLYFGTTSESYVVENATTTNVNDLDQLKAAGSKLPSEELPGTYTIVASRSHMSEETQAFADQMKEKHGAIELASMGSSLKICLVAEGKAHIYPRYAPTMEWDTAAGHAIAVGAGKELFDYETNAPMKYNREQLRNNWFTVK